MTQAETTSKEQAAPAPAPSAPAAAAETDPLKIANKIAMVEASPPEILALKPNKAEDATSGSDAVEAEKAAAAKKAS
jgi:hypothetical protein